MKLLKRFQRAFEAIETCFSVVAIALLVFMMLITTADVIMRYFFNSPIRGASDLTTNSLVWLTFLAAPWVLKNGSHVMVTLVTDRLNARSQVVLSIATSTLAALTCLLLSVYGMKTVLATIENGTTQPNTLGLPVGPLLIILPLSFILLTVRFALRIHASLEAWGAQKTPLEGSARSAEQLEEGLPKGG